MSWLARSIVNSLNLNDDDQHDDINDEEIRYDTGDDSSSEAQQQGRGVKEDLSELTKTLTRQFWGVASFLAPPVDHPDSDHVSGSNISDGGEISDHDKSFDGDMMGIRSDFAEIGGKFKSGLSKLSSNIAVSNISKIASSLLQFVEDQDIEEEENLLGGAVGVTKEVLAFARDIALHPETWLDFPLPRDDADDFDMSGAQQEHALQILCLAPELTQIRNEICPGYMSDGCFWMIYFVLLHPRLNKDDAEALSTPQIMQARKMLTMELKKETEAETYSTKTVISSQEDQLSVASAPQSEPQLHKTTTDESKKAMKETHFDSGKYPESNAPSQVTDKSIVEEKQADHSMNPESGSTSSTTLDVKDEDDGYDWFKEDSIGVSDITKTTTLPKIINEDDASFSDPEEDESTSCHKKLTYSSDSSTKDSAEWVQLSRSSTASFKDIETTRALKGHDADLKESNDWLNVDNIDAN